jgi:apolipoprotein N-acyltransferase
MRAVEEGLPLARAAQTGVSAVFDARGRLVTRGPLGESAIIRAPLPAPRAPTFYAELGLAISFSLSFAIFILGWILSGRDQR